MAELTYLDFDLWIGPAAEDYLAKARDSQGREATVDFRLPFSEPEVEDFWRRPDARPGEASRSYGGALFEALFHGELLTSFRRGLDQAADEGAGLRIRLRLADVPELANLPWEVLYDRSRDRFLALSVRTPVVRYLELPERLRPLAIRPPLKMLVMVASPRDCEELDAEQEWRRLREALGDLERKGLIELERLDGSTLPALQRHLRRRRPQIFHFIGHGAFDPESRQGTLILEDESGGGLPVSSEDLGVVLHDHGPRLAVLNACQGARTSRRDPFAGVAQTLIRQGVGAVVAMQTEIADDFALTLAHELYAALADGYPVDACLTEARKVLYGQQRAEWGAPVLYLRAPDGRLFDLGESTEDRAAAAAGSRPRTRRQLLNAALHLDRAEQWGAIQRIAHSGDDAYFLLYGQTFQNLRLFIERILHRLGEELRPHLVLELPYRLERLCPTNVHEWDQRLLAALKSRLRRRGGRLEDLLRAAAATQPLFLLLELPWNLRFEARHAVALRAFLEDRLPELMAAAGGMGTRLLVAAEYVELEESRHDEITRWMLGARARGVRFEPMAEVETPRRSDVVAFLHRLGYVKGHPEFDDVMDGYDRLATGSELDFERLSNFLDQQLRDPRLPPEDEHEEVYE